MLSIAVLLFITASIVQNQFSEISKPTVRHFEKALHRKETILAKELVLLAQKAQSLTYSQLFAANNDYYASLLQKEGIAFLIYENDTLKYWSDNSIAVENWIKEVCLDTRMVKLHNGWFEVIKPEGNERSAKTIIGLILIKNEFPYLNKYLTNEFEQQFTISPETKLVLLEGENASEVKDYKGNFLFSLQFNTEEFYYSTGIKIAALLYLLAIVLVFIFLQKIILSNKSQWPNNRAICLFVLSVFALRYASLKLNFPSCFYHFDFFKPSLFADASSIWLSSLGDLTINVLLLFYVTYQFFLHFSLSYLSTKKKQTRISVAIVILFLFFSFSLIISNILTGLIIHSHITFDINDFFALNTYSFISFTIVGVLLFIYFLFTHYSLLLLNQLAIVNKQLVLLFSISFIALSTICFLVNIDWWLVYFPLLILLIVHLMQKRKKQYPFAAIVFLIFLFSVFSVRVLLKYETKKELENRKVFAEKLAAEQDPIAEMLFDDIGQKLQNDTILSEYVSNSPKRISDFEKRIKQNYFGGYWEKYAVRVALFDSLCFPITQNSNSSFDNISYFDEQIKTEGETTASKHLYFLKTASSKISYLAKLPYYKSFRSKTKFGTLFIELDAKFISDEIGFPELLLDRNIGLTQELTNYAYAKYKNNKLIAQFGKYAYTTKNEFQDKIIGTFNYVDGKEYNHLVYKVNEQTVVILSKRNIGTIGVVTTFSYLFAFFSLLVLLFLFIQQLITSKFLQNFSFKYRIQMVLVSIILLSLALFGGATIYYIQQQFELKNKQNINEKIQSIVMDLENKFTETGLNKGYAEYATYVLKKLANVFFTDINMYDLNGSLYASSRPQVFEEGLTSKKMNPDAYLNMTVFGKSSFVHDERIGKLNYLSAYVPFRNKEGSVLAYVNLPYFAKQSELEKEISAFLVAVINIYVLLFALAIISAILISNYVTRPLKIIQDNLSKLKLGKTNQHIEWSENDEIGNLVSEYNRMIDALAQSAERLAKSERESAWREMAKQVAHEIKNPLTPMKLSVQHLQRTWKDHAPDMDSKMERLTKTIIEQIDTLSTIATEFSNFAQLPRINNEKVNLNETLNNCVALFSESHSCRFILAYNKMEAAYVLADKDQLVRAFNNLIKNAIQALSEEEYGVITINFEESNTQYIISFTDNGVGINEQFRTKIFTPNFTTKTTGMGLGLAIVKSSIESMNGTIWFETIENKGTTFYIALPSYIL